MKNDDDLASAWEVLFGTYIQTTDIVQISKEPSPEKIAIKKDLYRKLSDEAKEVISTILNCPSEFAEFCISPKTKDYRRRNDDHSFFIKKYFRKKWKSRSKVKTTFKEIEKYTSKII